MKELDVRIVQLEAMQVASVLGYGETPESDAWSMMQEWAEDKALLAAPYGRTFGFNNPDPTPGSPNYGYELWLVIPPGIAAGNEVSIKQFAGGLYAVTRVRGLENIGHAWKQLVEWCEESHYELAQHQWLEELLSAVEAPLEKYVLDIYLPIRQ